MTRRPDPHEPARPRALPPRSSRRASIAAACIFLSAAILYLPTLRNQFVWDDVALIENVDIRTLDASTLKRVFTTNFWEATETHSGLYRPLTALSFHVDYQVYRDNAGGFHLTNVLLNAIVCVLVLLVLLELFGRFDVALAAALFFTVFPMHVENVAWVSGRTDILATLLMLASLGCYARWRVNGRAFTLAGTLFFFALALLAKEIAVVFPAVVAVANLLPIAREKQPAPRWKRWGVVLGMLVLVACYFVVRKAVLGSSLLYFSRFTHGFLQAVALSLSTLAHYAYKLLFPFRLDAEADFMPPTRFLNLHTMVGLVIVVGGAYALYRWRRYSAFVFGAGVIACGLAPVLNILPLNQVLAERFLYFPSIGFSLLVALAVVWGLRHWRHVVIGVFVALLMAFAVRTLTRSLDWKDEMTLFQKTVEMSGDNARARTSLGASLYKQGQTEEALREFVKATELNPSYAPGWSGRARAEGDLGRVDDALEDIAVAINLDPDNALLFHHRGVLQFRARQYAEAAESFRRALEIRPRHLHARFNLGLALYQLKDFDGAIREFTALENKDTDFPNAWLFIAESETRRGNRAEAAQAARRFLSVHNTDDALAARARELAGNPGP